MGLPQFFMKCVAMLAIVGALVAAIVATPNHDYLGAYTVKMNRLEAPGPPRVIFIGGSGLAFGLDTRLAESSLGRPVVNLGLHAGLGLRFMLNHAAPYVRPGDLVVVVPEYATMSNVDSEDHGIWTSVFFSDFPRSTTGFSVDETAALCEGFPDFAFHRVVVGPAIRIARADREAYRFNDDGDEVGHLEAKAQAVALHAPVQRDVSDKVALLNDFAAGVEAKGARVVYVFPALAAAAFDEHEEDLASVGAELHRSLRFNVTDDPRDGRLPDAMFFDTAYHPSGEGRRQNTERMVRAILSSSAVTP